MENKLIELVIANGKDIIKREDINDNTDFAENLGYDSLEMINLIIGLEKEFKIEFSAEDLAIENLKKYGGLKRILQKYI